MAEKIDDLMKEYEDMLGDDDNNASYQIPQ